MLYFGKLQKKMTIKPVSVLIIFGVTIVVAAATALLIPSSVTPIGIALPISGWPLHIAVFLLTALAVCCIADRFRSRIANVLLLIVLVALQTGCVRLLWRTSADPSIEGWTVYPPLSALGPGQHHNNFAALFFWLQMVLTVMLITVALITARNWNRTRF